MSLTGEWPFAELLGLEVWDQGMMLGLRDPKTGVRSWEAHFVMPVISAFLPSGAEISLSQAAAPPLALPAALEGAPPPPHGSSNMHNIVSSLEGAAWRDCPTRSRTT